MKVISKINQFIEVMEDDLVFTLFKTDQQQDKFNLWIHGQNQKILQKITGKLTELLKKLDKSIPIKILFEFSEKGLRTEKSCGVNLSIKIIPDNGEVVDIESWKYNSDDEFSRFIDVSDEVNDLLISLIHNHGFTLRKDGGSYGYMEKSPHKKGILICTL